MHKDSGSVERQALKMTDKELWSILGWGIIPLIIVTLGLTIGMRSAGYGVYGFLFFLFLGVYAFSAMVLFAHLTENARECGDLEKSNRTLYNYRGALTSGLLTISFILSILSMMMLNYLAMAASRNSDDAGVLWVIFWVAPLCWPLIYSILYLLFYRPIFVIKHMSSRR